MVGNAAALLVDQLHQSVHSLAAPQHTHILLVLLSNMPCAFQSSNHDSGGSPADSLSDIPVIGSSSIAQVGHNISMLLQLASHRRGAVPSISTPACCRSDNGVRCQGNSLDLAGPCHTAESELHCTDGITDGMPCGTQR